jgi:hypothetical protein
LNFLLRKDTTFVDNPQINYHMNDNDLHRSLNQRLLTCSIFILLFMILLMSGSFLKIVSSVFSEIKPF